MTVFKILAFMRIDVKHEKKEYFMSTRKNPNTADE